MSTDDAARRARQRAEARDRKRRPRMKVAGQNVFALQRLLRKHR